MAEDACSYLLPRVFGLPGDRLSDAQCILVPTKHGKGCCTSGLDDQALAYLPQDMPNSIFQ